MLAFPIPLTFGARRLTGGVLALLLTGCGGDSLLLPGDGVPTQLRAVSGDGQSAPVGDPVRNPLVVEALDQSAAPVPGAVIVFAFVDPPRGAEIAPPTAETDATGRAAAAVVLGTPAGDQPVEARVAEAGSELSVRFLLTAIAVNRGGEDGGGDEEEEGGNGGGGGGGDDDGDDGDDGDNGGGGGDDGSGGGGTPDDRDDDERGGDRDDDDDDDDDRDDDDSDDDEAKGKGNGGKGKGKED
jgi:hypothetical protein